MSRRTTYTVGMAFLFALGCGASEDGTGPDGSGDETGEYGEDGDDGDDGTAAIPQCSNGVDDDGDALVDGFDPECTGPLDDLEDSFATGIPGDNIDAVKQDCFFDGDSGHGNDGCLLHTCCLLAGECPPELKPDQFDPADCEVSQYCIDFCAPLTPPGCDCFGCCTVCNEHGCFDVLTNPQVAPDCTAENVHDEAYCPACIKTEECGPGDGDCFPLECNLCPGMTPDDLPDWCEGQHTCPDDLIPCADDSECPEGRWCSTGCCIHEII